MAEPYSDRPYRDEEDNVDQKPYSDRSAGTGGYQDEEPERFEDEGASSRQNMEIDQPTKPSSPSRHLQQQQQRRGKPCCDFTTCILFVILAAMVAIFVLSFLIFGKWHQNQTHKAQQEAFENLQGGNAVVPLPPEEYEPPEQVDPLEAKIRNEVALQQGLEFAHPDSYQSHALNWIMQRASVFDTESRPEYGLKQMYALACLYYATGGNSHWQTHLRSSWMHGSDECAWLGVECNDEARITTLDVSEGGLFGTIPDELQLLWNVAELLLDDNPDLTGLVPGYLGKTLDLNMLTMENTGLSGHMPGEICEHALTNPYFILELDCDKIFCQPSCCDVCD